MNIFKKFLNWLKALFNKQYNKECIEKEKLLKYLDKNLPNKNKFSIKDIVEKLKELAK